MTDKNSNKFKFCNFHSRNQKLNSFFKRINGSQKTMSTKINDNTIFETN